MKLLLDQNLPRRIAERLRPSFAEVRHVSRIGLQSAADEDIWRFARDNGFAILSKDADFHHLSFRYGAPPKTIWLKVGNCSTDQLSEILVRNLGRLSQFLADDSAALMVITPDTVETRDEQR